MTKPAKREPVVLDTNVVSYLFKSNEFAERYRPLLDGRPHVLSFQTVAELEAWALERNWGPRQVAALRTYLAGFGVFESSPALAQRWALVRWQARQAGNPIDIADGWIAATALELNIPLVTHNVTDFAGVRGLRVLTAPEPRPSRQRPA